MKRRWNEIGTHGVLIVFVALTMLPFVFVINNSLRTNTEIYQSYFGLPSAVREMAAFTWYRLSGQEERIVVRVIDEEAMAEGVRAVDLPAQRMEYGPAMGHMWEQMTRGYRYASQHLRPYTLNTIFVSAITVLGVVLIGSVSAYVFSRYRFWGHKVLFLAVLSFMMIPAVLTFVPSFMVVKELGLLNSYWVLVLPYIAAGQVLAIFLFKGFFDGLPAELFESARLDGAGHFRIYWHIVLPLSKQIIAVVAIINILGAWNNFMWPFVTNAGDVRFRVIAQGLYLMGQSPDAANLATMFAAYVLASLPLLILFIYATKPFMTGVTSGAFKA
jgi:ABC-type glycerol-3-phosphate transport system permease component